MEPSLIFQKALVNYRTAQHLLETTFPLAKDTKVFLGVMSHTATALETALEAYLAGERQQQHIPPYGSSWQSKYTTFQMYGAKRFSPEGMKTLLRFRELLELQKRCPVTFSRQNRLVLSTDNYHLEIVSLQDVATALRHTHTFLREVEKTLVSEISAKTTEKHKKEE